MQPERVWRTPRYLVVTAPTPLGHIGLAVGDSRVAGVSIAHATALQAAERLARLLDEPLTLAHKQTLGDPNDRLTWDVLDRLVRFLEGEPVSLVDVPVMLDHLSPFQRRVAVACRAIPRGATRTYGQLAAAAGAPGAARAVGQVMAGNRTPLIVPCHRVVAASGLGGFSAPHGLTTKRRLLALEEAIAANAAATSRRHSTTPANGRNQRQFQL